MENLMGESKENLTENLMERAKEKMMARVLVSRMVN